jgi:hypothetical protein
LAGERFAVDLDVPGQLAAKLADPAGYRLIVLAGVSPRELTSRFMPNWISTCAKAAA